MGNNLSSGGVVRRLSKREILTYWLSFVLIAALVGATLQVAFDWTAGVALPLGFAVAFPLMSYREHRRLQRPVGRNLVIQTAVFWVCCGIGLLSHVLG